jgi:predicted RNase H-like nuclease (RuvC/YqgF family)
MGDQLAALITASSGILIAILAMAERARTKNRNAREAGSVKVLASWAELTGDLNERIDAQERRHDELLRENHRLQRDITSLSVKLARAEATEHDQARRIADLVTEVDRLRARIDAGGSA